MGGSFHRELRHLLNEGIYLMATYDLTGRNAIVTGSARGMGAQFALDLGKSGANVLLVRALYKIH